MVWCGPIRVCLEPEEVSVYMKEDKLDANERAVLSRWFFYIATGGLLLILLGTLASRNEEDIVKALWLLGGWLVLAKAAIGKSRWIQWGFFAFWLGGYIVGFPYAFHGRITWGDLWPFVVGGIWVLLFVALGLLVIRIWALRMNKHNKGRNILS